MESPRTRFARRRLPSMAAIGLVVCLSHDCHARKRESEHETLPSNTPAISSAASPAERLPMIARRPLMSLRIDTEHCAYLLFVNGGLVTANIDGDAAHEDQPINHWVHTGSNAIDLHMYKPGDEPDLCDVKIGVTVKDNDNDKVPSLTALVLAHSAKAAAAGSPTQGSSPPGTFDSHQDFRPSNKGDLRVGPAQLVHLTGNASEIHVLSRTFDVQLPFPEWAFFRGEKLRQWWEFKNREERQPTYEEILGAYRKVWSFLQKRDINGFLDACEERSREIDMAFYKQSGETRARLRKDLESAMNDPEFELTTLDVKGSWKYTVGSTGKLIALTQGNQASPIFRFQMKDGTPFSLIFPVVFRKEGDRYIITR